jgi:hypothetical protein
MPQPPLDGGRQRRRAIAPSPGQARPRILQESVVDFPCIERDVILRIASAAPSHNSMGRRLETRAVAGQPTPHSDMGSR